MTIQVAAGRVMSALRRIARAKSASAAASADAALVDAAASAEAAGFRGLVPAVRAVLKKEAKSLRLRQTPVDIKRAVAAYVAWIKADASPAVSERALQRLEKAGQRWRDVVATHGALVAEIRAIALLDKAAAQARSKGSAADARMAAQQESSIAAARARSPAAAPKKAAPRRLHEIADADVKRIPTGLRGVDAVLGGGIVPGAIMLISGDPGVGKSTLLMQLANGVAHRETVLYVTGEESPGQARQRADRVGAGGDRLWVVGETELARVEQHAAQVKPAVMIIDSIQTLTISGAGSPGSVAQLRAVTARLVALAKGRQIAIFVVGHVTKDGTIAGPRELEHMVDVVLRFEGERDQQIRDLRAVKNRHGSTTARGRFTMTPAGLVDAPPQQLDLLKRAPRPKPAATRSRAPRPKPKPAPTSTPRKARTMSEIPNPSQNAVDQITAGLLWLEQAQPRLAKPWEHGIKTERAWRKLAGEVHAVAHRLMPVIGACSKGTPAHLVGARKAAARARRAVAGGAMPRKRRKRRA